MKKIVVTIFAGVFAAAAMTASAAAISSASGSGHIVFGATQEFITFSAKRDASGTASGTAVVHDVTAGVTAKIDVNCLNVVGNTATISGIVTDLMSLANFHEVGVGNDCSLPGEFDLVPLTSGNIQVR